MALAEDAAQVLEQFVQDVANLPAEIHHLLEEIEAKDKSMHDCRSIINSRDRSVQSHYKQHGCTQVNPKEDPYSKIILANFEKAQSIQDEKFGLSEKACLLNNVVRPMLMKAKLDRQIKRLDIQLRQLESNGILAPDPLLPSLLHPSPANRVPPLLGSSSTTGTSTPLHPIHPNALPSTTIAHSTIARLVATAPASHVATPRHPSPAASLPATITVATAATPASSTVHLSRSTRESSLDAASNKRRRLNVPVTSSSLRQSSLGPNGTIQKSVTPTGSAVRAGSAGPRSIVKKAGKLLMPPNARHLTPTGGGASSKKGGPPRRKGGRKGLSGLKANASDTGEDEPSEVEASGSEAPGSTVAGRGRGTAAEEDVEMGEGSDGGDGDGDDRKYCTCRTVSYGNMIACDNPGCEFEWFHWSCVGMTKEPAGKWFCEACRSKGWGK